MKPTVLLFDIDGTLVTTGGVGRKAIERTFDERFGRPDACRAFPFDGMTDRAIFRKALTIIGVPADESTIDELLAVYIALLEEEVEKADHSRYLVHPGIVEALDAAGAQSATIAVGLGTGNVRDGARVKLSRVGIYDRFSFGGFGCDHEDRTALIRRGAERGAEKLGLPMEQCRIVVIGDTPKDVAAAKGIGAECLGVGTGSFTPAQLLECGAERAFQNLAEPGALEFLLHGR